MGLYNFQKRFVPFIEKGEKTHTIRAARKNPDKPGDIAHLYTGLRQKGARLIGRREIVKVEDIEIWEDGTICVSDAQLSPDEREQLARRDGFESFAEMILFWDGRLPFFGHIIHWRPIV